MTRYRFLDGLGDVVAEDEFGEREQALAWAAEDGPHQGTGDGITRVEWLGPEGDWRWAGVPGQ